MRRGSAVDADPVGGQGQADDGGEADELGRLVALAADRVEELDAGHGQGDGDETDDVALAEVQEQQEERGEAEADGDGHRQVPAGGAPALAPRGGVGAGARRVGSLPPGADRRDPRLLAGGRRRCRRALDRPRDLAGAEQVATGVGIDRRQVLGQRCEVEVGVGVLALVVAPDRGLAREARPRVDVVVGLVGQDLRHLTRGRLRPVRQGAGVVRTEAQRGLLVADDLHALGGFALLIGLVALVCHDSLLLLTPRAARALCEPGPCRSSRRARG